MADRTADYVITLGGDDAPLRALVNSFKTAFRSAASDIEAIASKITLFQNIESQVALASAAFFKATDSAAKFRLQIAQIEGAGGTVGKELIAALAATEKQVAQTSKEFNKQATQLDKLRASLTSAGVDTKNLAAEQTRLAAALQAQQRADADRNAAAVLGIKLTKDQTAEIQRQYAAFNTLRANGLASSKDIAAAQTALTANVKAMTSTVKEGAVAAESFGTKLKSGITGVLLPYIGITAAIAGVVAGIKAAIDASRAFDQALAEIGAQTRLSKGDVAVLGEEVRALAQELGIDLKEAFSGVKELLRSGVPRENVIEVLRLSAEAAKAAVVDVGVGVKASNLLLDAFGATVGELPVLLDKVTAGAHNGGASLDEFAKSGGPLLNVARATGQSFDELIAILTVMVDKSGNAEKSFADLTKILATLGKADTIAKLRGIGIESTNAVEIFQQLSAQGRTLGDVLGIDITGGGARSAASIAALTTNAAEVPAKLLAIRDAANEVKKSNEGLFDSPIERSKRFNAQLDQTELAFGKLFGSGSKFQVFATNALAGFNAMYLGVKPIPDAVQTTEQAFADLIVGMTGIPLPAAAVGAAMKASGEATAQAAKDFADAQIKIAGVKQELTGLSAVLIGDVKARQDALARDLADIQTRADAQVAALDRNKAAEAATAAATLAIRIQEAKDKLAAIQASEKAITDALNIAIKAREDAAKRSGENQKKIDADSAAARLVVVAQTLGVYQSLYAQLTALAQGAAARAQGFEEARVSVARSVEDAIRQVRFDALTGLDQYVARLAEVDRLVSEGRKKANEGDAAGAKEFFNQAIASANGLAKIVKDDGTVLITATQAATDKQAAYKKIVDGSNESLGGQAEAAKKGADETIKQADLIKPHIVDLQTQYDALKATIAEGLTIKVQQDEKSFQDAFDRLDELEKPRETTLTVTVNEVRGTTVGRGPESAPGQPSGEFGFRAGGLVRAARTIARNLNRGGEVVRGFARGGPVFRTPSWLKVPGSGSGDTVPARLQSGSYVVRKAASRYYGDGLMGAMARGAGVRGYAAGGTVTKDEVVKWAEKLFGGKDPFGLLGGKPSVGPGAPTGGAFPSQGQFPTGGQFPSGTGALRDKDIQKGVHPPISFDARPIPEELITAYNVLQYAREMLNAVGPTNRLLGDLGPAITQGITRVEAAPTDKTALTALLQAAETIGSNPFIFAMGGKTASVIEKLTPTWFVDWLTKRGMLDPSGNITAHGKSIDVSGFAQKFFGSSDFAQKFFGNTGIAQKFFSGQGQRAFAGGGGTDSVPAWLTPEEWVIKPQAVAKYGHAFMHGINTMAIPRAFVANMMAPPMPASRFAEGGPVGSPRTAFAGGPGNVERGPVNVHFTLDAGDLWSPENIRRNVFPVVRDAIRSGEIKVPTK